MNDKKQTLYTISWTQPYAAYVVSNPDAKAQPQPEPELMDLTLAREVLAKVMAK